MLKFTKDMVSGLNVSARDVHVGLVAYGSNASVVFPFNDNANEVNKLIDSTTPRPGVPRLDLALKMASQLFSPAFGARKRVPKVDFLKHGHRLNRSSFIYCLATNHYVISIFNNRVLK